METMLSYNSINTKIKAMSKNLISRDDYLKIANMTTVAEFIAYLKNHPGYHNIFKQYDENELHRFDAEQFFIFGFYHDYSKIYRYANQKQRNSLKLVFLRYEIMILKSCIHYIFNKDSNYDVTIFQEFYDRHSDINIPALFACQDLNEYVNLLRDTPYYSLFVDLLDKQDATPFDYEMQLDIYYFKRIWKMKGKLLEGNTLKTVTDRMGTEIDLLNIMWIYRAKTMYDSSVADVLSFIIPINYKLNKEQLFKLTKAATPEEYASILKTTCYNYLLPSLKQGTIKQAYQKALEKVYKYNKSKYPASMSLVHYYLFQKETEISRLTTALECIRYGLDTKEKLKYLLP